MSVVRRITPPKLEPNKENPVRWGILGCGAIATHAICPSIRWSSFNELVAVASRDGTRGLQKAKETQAKRGYSSYEELLEDEEIDAIYLGLPNGLHEQYTLEAARHGKHVLCAKSLTLSSASARRMVDACKEAGVMLMEGFMYRHHPQWDMVRTMVRDGKVGEVRLVRAGISGPLKDTVNHRWSVRLGGGALYDLTCYGVNVARMIFGREPLAVEAIADRATREGVDAASAALLDFGHGRFAVVTGSFTTQNYQYCTIEGTRGRISLNHPFIPGWERTTLNYESGLDSELLEVPGANHFLHQVEHFALCIQNPGRSLDPAEDGYRQSLVNEAIEQSWLAHKEAEISLD